MRVLIAEDDPVSRLMLQASLRKWGYDPVVTCNGREALSYFEQDSMPEMAVLDWMMPEMDGLEVCRTLRERFPDSPIYIILLTAKTQREDIVMGLSAGANDYVTKPFHQQELLARFKVGVRVIELQCSLRERVRELEVAMSHLSLLQQASKLESLGQMASGIAHEINTPIQYVGENLRFLEASWSQIQAELKQASNNPEIEYLQREVPKALSESLLGVKKVGAIVRAMRDFSQSSAEIKGFVDINAAIETSLTVAASRWRNVADIQTHLDPKLPRVVGFSADIHQVLYNLIVNAADAIEEAAGPGNTRGVIMIATSVAGDQVEIRVGDTGVGIREEHQAKIFDPFFTTKDVGRGSGQALAISYTVITKRHHGSISFESVLGEGTTFIIRLPIMSTGVIVHESETASSIR